MKQWWRRQTILAWKTQHSLAQASDNCYTSTHILAKWNNKRKARQRKKTVVAIWHGQNCTN